MLFDYFFLLEVFDFQHLLFNMDAFSHSLGNFVFYLISELLVKLLFLFYVALRLFSGMFGWGNLELFDIVGDVVSDLGWLFDHEFKELLDIFLDFVLFFVVEVQGNVVFLLEDVFKWAQVLVDVRNSLQTLELPGKELTFDENYTWTKWTSTGTSWRKTRSCWVSILASFSQ